MFVTLCSQSCTRPSLEADSKLFRVYIRRPAISCVVSSCSHADINPSRLISWIAHGQVWRPAPSKTTDEQPAGRCKSRLRYKPRRLLCVYTLKVLFIGEREAFTAGAKVQRAGQRQYNGLCPFVIATAHLPFVVCIHITHTDT